MSEEETIIHPFVVQAESEFQESTIHETFEINTPRVYEGNTGSPRIIEGNTPRESNNSSTKTASFKNVNREQDSSATNLVEITSITPHYFDFLKLIGQGWC